MELAAAAFTIAAATELLRRRRDGAAQSPRKPSSRYGAAVRPLFALDFKYTHLNHGSYGTAPYEVMAKASRIMLRIESFPDAFMRRSALGEFAAASDACGATIFKAPAGSTVFVENATAGVNAVLRSLPLKAGDVMLMFNHTYNACKNAINDTASKTGASVETIELPLPLTTSQALVEQLRAHLDAHPAVKFVLLDHITSPTAIVMPVAAMSALCKQRGIWVMVDGAHAPGQIPHLDVPAIGCDWYVGNLHKWVFALKGTALLYSAPGVQEWTQGVIISHFWRKPYQHRFFMQGTNDQSRYLSAADGIAFLQERLGGFAAMQEYNASLASAGADILCSAWGTSRAIPSDMCAPFLVMLEAPLNWRKWVRRTLPDGTEGDVTGLPEAEAVAAMRADEGLNERIANAIFYRAGIQSVFFPWEHGGRVCLFNRISAQVYNTEEDYRKLAAAVLALKAETEGTQ